MPVLIPTSLIRFELVVLNKFNKKCLLITFIQLEETQTQKELQLPNKVKWQNLVVSYLSTNQNGFQFIGFKYIIVFSR